MTHKTLGDLKKQINKLLKEHPEWKDLLLISSSDSEGNDYHKIYNDLSPAQVHDIKQYSLELVGFEGEDDIAVEDINCISCKLKIMKGTLFQLYTVEVDDAGIIYTPREIDEGESNMIEDRWVEFCKHTYSDPDRFVDALNDEFEGWNFERVYTEPTHSRV